MPKPVAGQGLLVQDVQKLEEVSEAINEGLRCHPVRRVRDLQRSCEYASTGTSRPLIKTMS